MLYVLSGVLGLLVGGLTVAAMMIAGRARTREQLTTARTRCELLDQEQQRLLQQLERAAADLRACDEKREAAERQAALAGEQSKWLAEAEKKLATAFEAMGAKALRGNNEQFLELATKTFQTLMAQAAGDVEKKQQAIDNMVKPIRELLDKQNSKLGEIEKQREADKSGLTKQLEMLAQANHRLGDETSRLVTALRKPQQRGQWGEMQLRNVVELAGMTEHCDFIEQPSTMSDTGVLRPDMIVKLPGEGVIVVDSKVALDAYLTSIEPEADRAAELQRHTRHIETHVRQLAAKAYWDQFERTPQLVVMFMPLESALLAALELKPDLHSTAMKQHVLIATPTLLVALLRAVAYGWQQDAIAQNAREIADVGRDLYSRLATFAGHLENVGKGLDRANTAYNRAVGSLERNVLPGTRRLRDLRATNAEEIESPKPIEIDVREITSSELRPSSGDDISASS